MAELRSCDGKLSREHLISESVMRLLAEGGAFTIGGTPWLPDGEMKTIGFDALVAKCLCKRHNSAINHLDDAALSFFKSLRSAFENEDESSTTIVSGHDIERWLLKTLKAMAVSGNLGRGSERLNGQFTPGIDVLGLLEQVDAWSPCLGLYCVMAPGELTQNHNRFQLAPLTALNNSLSGLWANILGLSFILMLEPFDLRRNYHLRAAVHRPGGIIVDHPNVRHTLIISWDDGRQHREALSLRFVEKVSIACS